MGLLLPMIFIWCHMITCFSSIAVKPSPWEQVGHYIYKNSNLVEKTDQLSKRFYRIAIIESPPFAMNILDSNGNIINHRGIVIEIIKILASKMDFNYTFVLQNLHGILLANGSWEGAVGSLIQNEVDMIAADLSMTSSRVPFIDFTVPFVHSTVGVLIRKPSEEATFSERVLSYELPFHWPIWILMMVSWQLGTALLYYGKFVQLPTTRQNENKERGTWGYISFQLFRLFVQQGCDLTQHKPSGRAAFLTVCFTAFICFSFYTSVLTSFTMVIKTSQPVSSLEDVFTDKSFQVGYIQGSYSDKFMVTTDPVFKEAWSRIQKSKTAFVKNIAEGIARAYREKYALFIEINSMRWFTAGNCKSRLLQEQLLNEGLHFAFPRHSPDTQIFSKYINLLVRNGVMAHLKATWMPANQPGFCKVAGAFSPVGLEQTIGIFLSLMLGFAFAGIALCFENIWTPK